MMIDIEYTLYCIYYFRTADTIIIEGLDVKIYQLHLFDENNFSNVIY